MRPTRLCRAWENLAGCQGHVKRLQCPFLWRLRLGQQVSRRNPGAYKEASFQGIWEVTYISWKAEGVRGQAFIKHVLTCFC